MTTIKSIEEKARRYDKALERANKLKETCDSNAVVGWMEYIFPELKESEDEKILKHLKAVIKAYDMWAERGLDMNDVLAWIEKQGEHANFRNKIQIGDKVTRNEDGVLVNLSQLNRVAKKQGEQKPADKVEPKFHEGDIIKPKDGGHEPWQIMQVDIFDKKYRFKDGYVIHFSQEDDYELVEQKPAWSEEDEKQARQIERIVHNDGCTQKLQKQIADWLKSLKERYTWKPSDEQMDALRYVTNFDYGGYKATLVSLYEQLKKLRGGDV